MRQKQTRYETEQEILADIDRSKTRAAAYNAEAEDFENQAQEAIKKAAVLEAKAETLMGKEAHEMFKEANRLTNDFHKFKELARKARKNAKSIEEVRLPNLGRTLAAFKTVPMLEICGLDKGVVYQNQ